jgi:hypothetical protein
MEYVCLLDLLPQVTVVGSCDRMDKMLKYTVYVVSVKVKMVRQKVFLRFSELLELERFVRKHFGELKQRLVVGTWLNNHHPRTI